MNHKENERKEQPPKKTNESSDDLALYMELLTLASRYGFENMRRVAAEIADAYLYQHPSFINDGGDD